MNIPILRISFDKKDKSRLAKSFSRILDSNWLSMGKNVRLFEEKFAALCKTKYAIAANSGTGALEMLLECLNIHGKEVIIPSNTYIATAIAVVRAGGKVVFCDCDRESLCIDPVDLQRKTGPNTAGAVLVHIGGYITGKLEQIKSICGKANIFLVEDAAHAHGASIDGVMAGNLSEGGAFSFYSTKVLTSGEGGILTTNNERIAAKAKILREHGKTDPAANVHEEFGYTWTLGEFQAAVALQQTLKANTILKTRRKIAAFYDGALEEIPLLEKIEVPRNIKPSYYKYICYLKGDSGISRESLKRAMKEKFGVSLPGEVYSVPLHRQPVFEKYKQSRVEPILETLKSTEYVCKNHICLPLYPGLENRELDYIVKSLKTVLGMARR